MKISDRRRVTRSGIELTALGLGAAAFGGLYAPVPAADALDAMAAAWKAGIRYFDVAPMYGLGRSEHLVGHFFRECMPESDSCILSTKVGRLIAHSRPGRPLPPERAKNPLDPGWHGALTFREVFDYSYDGIMRSFDDSQQRFGMPNIDLLYVHDIGPLTHAELHEAHWSALTAGGGFRALGELRSAGLIGGFGLGVNEPGPIAEAMNEADLDCCLLAGRYTLLDRSAEPLLQTALRNGVSIIAGGVYNSGILASGEGRRRKFDYRDAPPTIEKEVERLTAICHRFGVPLGAAAVQFPLRHPAIRAVLVGARNSEDVSTSAEWFDMDIPDDLWSEIT